MRSQARCAHPGCERPATEVAVVVESAWEDSATGSALMVCAEHADRYARRATDPVPGAGGDVMLRAHRRGPAR